MTNQKLILGDCHEELKKIPDNSIDLIFTDPPFATTNCKWDSPLDWVLVWKEIKRIRKKNAPTLLFAQTPFDKVLGCSNIKELRYEWIWEKTQATGHLNAKKMPMKAHENILVFYEKIPVYNFIKTKGHERKVSTAHHKRNSQFSGLYGEQSKRGGYDSTERYPRSVIKFPSDKQKLNLHPTQKPLGLIEYFVKTYSNEGDLVLDFTSGSCTLAVASEKNGRNSISIDETEKFLIDGQDRLNNKYGELNPVLCL